jgi:hypothetical protein
LQPNGTLAPAAHIALRVRSLGALVASGLLGLPSRDEIADPVGTLTFHVIELAVALCAPELDVAGSALSLCLHSGGGGVRASATGFDHNGHANKLWFELGPEASVRVPLLGPMYVRLAARIPVRLSRPSYAYSGPAELALGIDFF